MTSDNRTREIDTLICATGYSIFDKGALPTCEIVGANGVELGEYWRGDRYKAFQGVTVPNYPNYFMIFGPYATASASWFDVIDTQVRHIMRCIKAAKKQGANYIEVKNWAHERDFEKMLKLGWNSVLFAGNCGLSRSYYYDRNGDAPLLRPVTYTMARLTSYFFSMDNYNFATKI